MFFWIIWALLSSLWDIAYKKSVLVSGEKLSNYSYQFVRGFFSFCIVVLLYFLISFVGYQSFLFPPIKIFFIFVFIWLFSLFENSLYAYAYKNEKIAVLSPYQQIDSILTVVFGFFFFSWVSITSLIFVLIAWFSLIVWSLDFKKMTFNKYALSIIIACIISSLKTNILAYVLIYISPIDSILYSNLFAFSIAFLILFFKKQLRKSVVNTNKQILTYINLESFVRVLIWFIYAFLVSELWVVQATLLWLLTIFSNMIFAYFVFKEIPAKKDLSVAFIVIACIILGTIL